jgi:hypothetical protein
VLPFRRPQDTQENAYGLIWLAARNQGEFDGNFERGGVLIQETFEKALARIFQSTVEDTLLHEALRTDVHQRLMRGENPIDRAEGVLIQIDLVGSTKISALLGEAAWKIFQRDCIGILRKVGAERNLTAEVFIWDAMFFTRPDLVEPSELLELYKVADQKIKSLRETFNVQNADASAPTIRICATFGDITREIRHGSWTITGYAMAKVSKLEQSIKGQTALVAVADDLFEQWKNSGADFGDGTFDEGLGAWLFRLKKGFDAKDAA